MPLTKLHITFPRLVALLCAFLLIGKWAGFKSKQNNQNCRYHDASTSQNSGAHTQNEQSVPPTIPPGHSPDQAREEQHRGAERRYWKWSIVTSAASALAACVAVYFAAGALSASWEAAKAGRIAAREAHEQAIQARRQADAAINQTNAELRPWLYPEIRISSAEVTPSMFKVDFMTTLQNTGRLALHNPVLNISFSHAIITQFIVDGRIGNTCEYLKHRTFSVDRAGGIYLAPGQSWTTDEPREIPIVDHTRLVTREHRNALTFLVYGCVVYRLESDQDLHFTSFKYRLGMKNPASDATILPIDASTPRAINPNDLRLLEDFYGTEAK